MINVFTKFALYLPNLKSVTSSVPKIEKAMKNL